MKLIMSPEKEEGESFPFTPHPAKGGVKKEKDRDRMQLSKSPKKKLQQNRDPLPVVGKEVEVEGKKPKWCSRRHRCYLLVSNSCLPNMAGLHSDKSGREPTIEAPLHC